MAPPYRMDHYEAGARSWEKQGHATVRCHPLYDDFVATFCPSRADQNRILLADPPRLPLQPLAMPRERTVWALPPNLIERRAVESASSIENSIGCPLRWTLKYAAHVQPHVLGGLADGELLASNLAHRVIEEVIVQTPLPTPTHASWLALEAFDSLIALMAAPLLLPSRATERMALRNQIARATSRLATHLRDAGLTVEGIEAGTPASLPRVPGLRPGRALERRVRGRF